MLKIAPRKLMPYRSQGNPTERENQIIKQCLKMYADVHKEWDRHLNVIAFAISTSVNETTGFSPAFLTFSEELRSPFDSLQVDEETATNMDQNMAEQDAKFVVTDMQEKMIHKIKKKN
jgi:hypothetical protein